MQIIEKRATNRNNSNCNNGTPLIEIKHSFGTQKISAYQIQEHNEKGLSFLVPKSEGYFRSNTPIQFNINNNGNSRNNLTGTVKYYQPHYDNRGENYFKIGVEIQDNYRNLPRKQHKLRTQRYIPKNGISPAISFTRGNNCYKYSLIDVSKYSAAFHCDTENMRDLNVNGPLNNVKISFGEKILYDGTCTISQAYEDAQKKNRVVIEPRHKLINIDLIEKHETERSIASETTELIEKNKTFKDINVDFIAGVADLRILLEEFKTYLETPKLKADLEKNSELLELIYKIFYPAVDGKIKHIDRLVAKLDLDSEKTAPYKEYYQKHLRSLFLAAPFINRIFSKPSGYPGDYEMINMVHRNALEGKTPLDKLLNKYASSIPIAKTVRKRTEFFTNEIKNLAQKNSTAKVLSIASGPALEFEMLLKKYPKLVDDVSITLLDQDINALRFSQENLYKTRIETQSKVKIDFIQKNIGTYLKELNRNKIRKNFDIVYASGLFDYFDCKTSKFVIKYLLKQTRPGGKIIIANLSKDGHDHRTILEFVGEWYLIYRSREDMVKLSEAIPKGIDFEIKEIEKGLCKFIEIQV